MQLLNGCWTDENENTWSEQNYTESEALRLSKTLVNCRECHNCSNCRGCLNCLECQYCFRCKDCHYLIRCNNCKKCHTCDDCVNCIICEGCIYCTDCYWCVDSNYLRRCRYCEKCTNCDECKSCYYVSDFSENPNQYTTPPIENYRITFYWNKYDIQTVFFHRGEWDTERGDNCKQEEFKFTFGLDFEDEDFAKEVLAEEIEKVKRIIGKE